MKLCKDCKYFLPNSVEWGTENYQRRYAICTLTSKVDGFDGNECFRERKTMFFGCGPNGKNFEARN